MEEIENAIKKLNKFLVKQELRRNSKNYEYICYINNIYTFCVCGLYDEASLFINRAYRYLDKNKEHLDFDNGYIFNSKEFIENMVVYIDKHKQ